MKSYFLAGSAALISSLALIPAPSSAQGQNYWFQQRVNTQQQNQIRQIEQQQRNIQNQQRQQQIHNQQQQFYNNLNNQYQIRSY